MTNTWATDLGVEFWLVKRPDFPYREISWSNTLKGIFLTSLTTSLSFQKDLIKHSSLPRPFRQHSPYGWVSPRFMGWWCKQASLSRVKSDMVFSLGDFDLFKLTRKFPKCWGHCSISLLQVPWKKNPSLAPLFFIHCHIGWFCKPVHTWANYYDSNS